MNIKDIWNKSLYKINGQELDLFKEASFIEYNLDDLNNIGCVSIVLYQSSNEIAEIVDLDFIKQYQVFSNKEMVVYRLPIFINFQIDVVKLKKYFRQISIGKFNNNDKEYLLRIYLI